MDSPPPRPLPTETPNAGGNEFDDLDNLFDYDAGDANDPFSDNYVVPGSKGKEPTKTSETNTKSGAGLGIDEEIQVTKKPRVPRVKLDEHKLLSSAGIPKLRKKAAGHLKFKGKGHEYSDTARLLAFYQLWLDDLFPKAKFADALAMVEKLGHKKMLQSARMEWINEGKAKSSVHEDSLFDEPELPPRDENEREKTVSRIAPIFETAAGERPKTPVPDQDPDFDDMYDSTPKNTRQNTAIQSTSVFGSGNDSIFGPPKVTTAGDDGPPDDDLEALLAEAEQERGDEEMLDDDIEALLAANNDNAPASRPAKQDTGKPTQAEDEDLDAMEAMMDMDGGW
ncbi:hypothetical protein BOTNAR_0108g00140 [Botryotinia narcissicola]|uniref:Chromosome segregation in meiosis protein n=1 Tax=Botryotinia narcissicola TaxID=278944 RepID=A0A4Z1J119_9HELO|nr:hypothetical protein BOTNAR_0108g00140 [Botryotinia narcissicola]